MGDPFRPDTSAYTGGDRGAARRRAATDGYDGLVVRAGHAGRRVAGGTGGHATGRGAARTSMADRCVIRRRGIRRASNLGAAGFGYTADAYTTDDGATAS
ncbi:hypothetical protein [Fodinicola acaciae]|uniref:hypothetical protein n=1 Tax=Fodinicola acaciae TaxID=2681555 RepID=UPI0013D54289|nr:hypothetical protein [Fodinicola acaciae]